MAAVPKLSRRAKIILVVVLVSVLVAGLAAAVGIYYWRKNGGGGGGGGGGGNATMNFNATTSQWEGTFSVTFDPALPTAVWLVNDVSTNGTIYAGYMPVLPGGGGYGRSLTAQTWGAYMGDPQFAPPTPNDVVEGSNGVNTTMTQVKLPASFSTLAYDAGGNVSFA